MTSTVHDEVWERLVTTGTHAYLFFDLPDERLRGTVQLLRAAMPGADAPDEGGLREAWSERGWSVLSASEFIGPFAAFAHLRVSDGLADLQDFIAALRRTAGIRGELAVAGGSYRHADSGVTMMAKAKKCAIVGLVRVWVRKSTAEDTLRALHDELGPTFKGATIVFGGFDVLLELGADELDPVLQAAAGPLQTIDTVVRTETALADFRRYDAAGG